MSTLPPDPYKTLGVSKDAEIPEIRSAHRKLVLKCHPDKVQDPTLKAQKADEFQKVQQAYELLSDEKERQRYDDQARLAELREQLRAKAAASSSSRSAGAPTYKYEIRTNDRSYKTSSPNAKVYTTYSRSWDDDPRGADMFDSPRTVKKEASYSKSSKREERERERERELRDREKEREREIREQLKERERERERRKKADEASRRAEKEAKEARRAEKKQREKEREKERKRETEEKKRHTKPYIETYDDEEPAPKPEKKKTSKKHDERRDRSSPAEDAPTEPYQTSLDQAINYIQASRNKGRTHISPPAAPTPPPVPGQSSPFPVPDDDVRRSSAKPRRGSAGEKAYKKPSKEVLEDPIESSPSARPHLQKSATSTGILSGSPPRRDLPRQSTMPPEGYGHPMPHPSRPQSFNTYAEDPRGRARSKMQPQIYDEMDEDEEYERHRRDRKHRSKKHRSPEAHGEHVLQYRVDGGRTTLQNSYSRSAEPPMDSYSYYPSNTGGVRVVEARPSMPPREGSYSHSSGFAKYSKYKTSKSYDFEDIQYSNYHPEYAYAGA
ncbi:hypothetical protein ACJZ2D_005410 [Fusarium nematophilum]